jgi:hypothetical protein
MSNPKKVGSVFNTSVNIPYTNRTFLFEADPRAEYVDVRQYDKNGDEVARSQSILPKTPRRSHNSVKNPMKKRQGMIKR